MAGTYPELYIFGVLRLEPLVIRIGFINTSLFTYGPTWNGEEDLDSTYVL